MPVVRRKWIWARRLIVAAPVGANSAVFSDLLTDVETALGADLIGCTIMRVRGLVQHNFGGSTLGIRVYTASTFATLATANGPRNDPYADWMGYVPLMTEGPAAQNTLERIDIQSSRKLEEVGQSLLLSVENGTATAGAFSADLSIGVKLP